MTGLNIAIAGAAGRMGKALVTATLAAGHKISGASAPPHSQALDQDIGTLTGQGPLGVSVHAAHDQTVSGADVWIDFTTPQATLLALDHLVKTGIQAVIIGTTGFNATGEAKIAKAANRLTIVKSGNFSLGVAVLTTLVRQTASQLDAEWDIDILDTHHRHKADAPSGTALMLGQAAAQGRSKPFSDLQAEPCSGAHAKRQKGAIGFASRRSGGTVGAHEVTFAAPMETLTLGHMAHDRAVFAHGAIRAAEWAVTQGPGLYSLHDVLGLPG